MKITRLSLDNVRAFDEAEFEFNPGFNLIIGINGAGKSTVLDAIRFCGSHLLPALQKMPFKPFGFGVDDIHSAAPFAEATIHLSFGDDGDAFVRLREWREHIASEPTKNIEKLRREILETARPRDRLRTQLRELQETVAPSKSPYFYPSGIELKTRAGKQSSAPLIIHYSTARSIMNEQAERKSAAGTTQLAYVNALQSNTLSLRQFADWMRAQIELSSERPASRRLIEGISIALERFLPGYSNLRPSKENASRVEIDVNGTTLDVRKLSDGERSVLALVLDIAKRLAQANPRLEDPLTNAEAVILIDEVDLHLHPQWQRKIVENLERTFPSCQFIATTHSPQIIGETQPDRILLLQSDGKRIVVNRCGQAFGLDTNAILEQIMGTPSRAKPVRDVIADIETALDNGDLESARKDLARLREIIHGDDPTVVALEATINNLEALGDAADQ